MSHRIENIDALVGQKIIIHGLRGKYVNYNNKVGKILQTSQQDKAKGRVLINLKVSENKIVKASTAINTISFLTIERRSNSTSNSIL